VQENSKNIPVFQEKSFCKILVICHLAVQSSDKPAFRAGILATQAIFNGVKTCNAGCAEPPLKSGGD
jgi:hypothetical protein